MQAIILAAGMGKRLKELTQDRTKCMVQVNGVALIDRMLHQIERRHLSRIVIVVGYEGEKLMEYIDTLGIRTPIVYVHNPIYDKTNNIYSLALAKDYLCQDDTLLFESDLIFEDSVIDQLLDDPRETLALVDKYKSWMDGTCVKLGADDSIESFVPGKSFKFQEAGEYYKTVNIYKFGRHFPRPTTSPSWRRTPRPWVTTSTMSRSCGSSPCWMTPRSGPSASAASCGTRSTTSRTWTLPRPCLPRTRTSRSA